VYSIFFMLINFLPLAIEAIDIEGYRFFGRRSTLSTLSMLNDIRDQALQLIVHFWYIPLICILIITSLVLLFRQVSRRVESSRLSAMTLPLPAWISLGFVTVAMTTLGIQGGLQSKPLRPAHAFSSQSTVLAALALNTTFNVIHNKPGSDVQIVNYLPPQQDLHGILGRDPEMGIRFPPSRDNTVIILLEGFSL
jgi:hypothetical protein